MSVWDGEIEDVAIAFVEVDQIKLVPNHDRSIQFWPIRVGGIPCGCRCTTYVRFLLAEKQS